MTTKELPVVSGDSLPTYFRAPEGVYKRIDSPWGTHYVKVPDPKGKPKPPELDEFWLRSDFSKLPTELLQAIVSLFRSYLEPEKKKSKAAKHTDTTTEVQVCLLRNEEDPNIWKVVVPRQIVGSVTVDATLAESCDILTGEEYTVFPPVGWLHAGSVHSHHSMDSFWSPRDDKGELGVPGMHCTVGKLIQDAFTICCSIVMNQKRYIVEADDCLELTDIVRMPVKGDSCHNWKITLPSIPISDKVHKYITKESPRASHTRYDLTTPLLPRASGWKSSWQDDWERNYKNRGTASDWFTELEKDKPGALKERLQSSGFRQDLLYLMDALYAIQGYNNRKASTYEEKEALSFAKDVLIDILQLMAECNNGELAVIEAVAIAFDLTLDEETEKLLDFLNM
jgi:hypothetical protein